MSVFDRGPHVTITHDAQDATVPLNPPLTPSTPPQWTSDLATQLQPLPLLVTSGDHQYRTVHLVHF